MRGAAGLLCWMLALSACDRDETDYAVARERLKQYALGGLPAGVTPLSAVFGGKLRLLGYRLEPAAPLKAGTDYTLTLYWRADKPVSAELRVGTELLDEAGNTILNLDDAGPLRKRVDGRPALPPAGWERGKVYADAQSFRMPRGRAKKVQFVAEVTDGHQRLAVTSGAHEANRAAVATVEVERRKRRSQVSRLPSAHVEKLDASVKIAVDGKLDEPAWSSVPALGFVDVVSGETNRTFPVDGTVRLLWNDLGFYVGFEIRDPDVVGGFDQNEKDPHLWTRDAVEIMVDPDGNGDNEDYYEIQINPQNLVFDSRFDRYNEPKTEPDGPFGHEDWSAHVKSAVRVGGTLDRKGDRDEGYVVEALVPWKAFVKARHAPPRPGDTWRLNFYAMQENSGVAWSPILGQGNFHKASRFGRVVWTERGRSTKPEASSAGAGARMHRGMPQLERRFRTPKLSAPVLAPSNSRLSPAP